MRWGREERVGAATFRTAPKPSAFTQKMATIRAVSMGTQDRESNCPALEMLGYHQPETPRVTAQLRVDEP